jgi:polar amino acid transport system substrate-binding protein
MNRLPHVVRVVALALALAGLACGAGGRTSAPGPSGWAPDLLEEIQQRKVLRVAMTLQFPPQFYRDPATREPAGYDVELMRMMAKDLGAELKIEDMDFTGQVPALLAGNVDLIANGLVNTPERAKTLIFSEPYVPYELVLMVQRDRGLTSVDALNQPGRIVSMLLGSVSHELAKVLLPKAELRPLERQDGCMLEVASKRSDACLLERYLAIPFVRNNSQTTEILATDRPLAIQYGCLALRPGSPRLLYWVNNWLKYYRASGVLDAMYERIIGPSLKLGPA